MEDYIKHLIELDKRARAQVEAAHLSRDEAKAQIAADKQRLAEERLAQVKEQAAAAKAKAKADSAQELVQATAQYEQLAKALDEQFLQNKNRWTTQIVTRCLDSNRPL